MNIKQARLIIKDVFNNSFNRGKFIDFAGNLFNLRTTDHLQRKVGVSDPYTKHIESLEIVAKFSDGKNDIDVLIVTLVRDTSLDRARTMQRNFVARYLAGERTDAAVVAFISPDTHDWRFSLIKMDYKFNVNNGGIKVEKEVTPAKRWSFLVGKNENSHTAQSQLVDILTDDETAPTLERLEQAFNIETVTNEFFEKYTDLFLRMKEELDVLLERDPQLALDFKRKEIDTSDFAKKTMGQMAFLYFLQKKGWFGVDPGKEWGSGIKNFLRRMFERREEYGKNFFDDVLEPLFYEALAQDRGNDSIYPKLDNCRMPFLNGGLFEPMNGYSWETTHIRLPDELFSNSVKTKEGDIGNGILDIFDRYNFTVNESDPLEQEVAVDPEMLGKVFENLLEVKDRSSKGTFYTPREIVRHMCQDSLIDYLLTKTNNSIPKTDIELFIRQDVHGIRENDAHFGKNDEIRTSIPDNILKNAGLLDELLFNIKICDPAVGSGAFPLGMLNEIVAAREILNLYLGQPVPVYDLKLHAISNSIYGVDIDPGAIEISKLRLWLSLVVEENSPTPLPNLEHKIMQGNSLVSHYEGIELFNDEFLNSTESDNEEKSEIRKRLDAIQREYFSLHDSGEFTADRKAKIEGEIKKLQRRLGFLNKKNVDTPEERGLFDVPQVARIAQQKARQLQTKIARYVTVDGRSRKEDLKKEIEYLKWDLIEATLEERGETSKLSEIKRLRENRIKPFFIWRLEFGEVFKNSQGFDIVIGNPPYVESRNKDRFPEQLKRNCQISAQHRWGDLSSYIANGADLMIYFFELSIGLLSPGGVNSFITQNSWLSTEYGAKFQKFLTSINLSIRIEDSHKRHFNQQKGPSINTVISFIRKNRGDVDNCITLTTDSLEEYLSNESKTYKFNDPLLDYKWSILFQPSFVIDVLKSVDRCGSHSGYSIGQGLNSPQSCFYSIDKINDLGIGKEIITPIFTKSENGQFVVDRTCKFIVDSFKLKAYSNEYHVGDNVHICNISKQRAAKRPALILPRGIGSYFCAKSKIELYSSSFVEVYSDNEKVINNLWVFLNSSIGFLLREVSGRFNLGGGMLKAEASDLKKFPLYFDFDNMDLIDDIIQKSESRVATTNIGNLLKSEIQVEIDNIVFDYFNFDKSESKKIKDHLIYLIDKRENKSKIS